MGDHRESRQETGGVGDPFATVDEPEHRDLNPTTPIQHSPHRCQVPPDPSFPVIPGYELLGELGRGGMGVVYHARHQALNREVALKTILGSGRPDPRELRRFLLEAEAVALLRHPHVVQVYDFGERSGCPYMALELLPGGTLTGKLSGGKTLPANEAAVLVSKIARGVSVAHEAGLVHRDLKPGNVLFDSAGEPKVTDFGLVKMGSADLTRTGAMMGTPAYMAPEQGRDAKYVGPEADVWALGVILYECLTGRRPFRGADVWSLLQQARESNPETPRSISPNLPRDLELVCLKCLEKTPADRYRSAAELADDLDRITRGECISVRAAGIAERVYRWARRRPTAAAAWGLGVLAAFLLGFGAVVASFWSKAEEALEKESEARKAEAEATRSANEARAALAESARARRQERARKSVDGVVAQLPDLRRRALWRQASDLIERVRSTAEGDLDQTAAAELATADADIRLLARLDDIRMRKAALAAERPDRVWHAADIRAAYHAAFAEAGLVAPGGGSGRVASLAVDRLAASAIREELVAALDDWAWMVRDDSAGVIWEATARVKGQPWRASLRYTAVSAPEALRLSREVPVKELTPPLVCGIGFTMRLVLSGDGRHPIRWLEAGAREYPSDFWVAFYLGIEYMRLREFESGAGAFRAAAAIRPDSQLARDSRDRCLSEVAGRPPANK